MTMTTATIAIYWARKNDPDTVLAEAVFTNDAFEFDGQAPYRIVLRRLPADEGDYVVEDTLSDERHHVHYDLATHALAYFLRVTADEVRRLNEPRDGSVLADPERERAEAIRARVYGHHDPADLQDADRAAIEDWLRTGSLPREDPLADLVMAWSITAQDTGYDRTRILRLVVQTTGDTNDR
jgi:hypothetical protein